MNGKTKTLPLETTAAMAGFRASVRDRVLNERIDAVEKLLRADMRALVARCVQLEGQVKALQGQVLVLESGSRTPAERREAAFRRIASCGEGGGNVV